MLENPKFSFSLKSLQIHSKHRKLVPNHCATLGKWLGSTFDHLNELKTTFGKSNFGAQKALFLIKPRPYSEAHENTACKQHKREWLLKVEKSTSKKVAQNASIKSEMSSEGSGGAADSFGSDFGSTEWIWKIFIKIHFQCRLWVNIPLILDFQESFLQVVAITVLFRRYQLSTCKKKQTNWICFWSPKKQKRYNLFEQ